MRMITISCKHCGKKREVRDCVYKYGTVKFCSQKCLSDSRNKKVIIKCIVCGKERKLKKAAFLKYNSKFCSRQCLGIAQRGEKNPLWTGGITKTGGYILLYAPNHPNAPHYRISRSRLVMEKSIGRYLDKSEIVHHVNRIKTDDRIENLKIVTNSEHRKIHSKKNG